MVTRRSKEGIRGAGAFGCLLSLVLTIGVLYYGLNLGRVWWRYKELQSRMDTAARFAQTQTIDQVTRQLQADARDIGVPPAGQVFKITRVDGPPRITISTSYTEEVNLPLLHKIFAFHPSVTHKFF
jgi:hypothetical protein